MSLYDLYLATRCRRHESDPPHHLAVLLTERDLLEPGAYTTLEQLFQWAVDYGCKQITVAVSVLDDAVRPVLETELAALETPLPQTVIPTTDMERSETPIQIVIGVGGKQEFVEAVRDLATAVARDTLDPDEIDQSALAERLVFSDEPDLLMKTGAERLSDFAIWQSVYSELYFCDINFRDLRKRDFLRAVLAFQDRQRRFGK